MTTIPFVDENRLVALIQDPSTTRHAWTDRAACTDLPVHAEPYFPPDGEMPSPAALARCAVCLVADECLASALVHEVADGIRCGWWGGFSPAERDAVWDRLGVPTTAVEISLRTPAAIARHLRAQNRTIPSIATELGCTERTVYRYLAVAAA